MVRVWLRPCAAAIAAMGRRAAPGAKAAVLQAQAPRSLVVHAMGSEGSPLVAGVRMMATKGKDKKELKKKSTFEKVVEEDDPTELPPDVQYLGQQELEDGDDFEELELEDEDDFEDDEDAEDAVLSPQQWAEKFEREVATWDGEDDEDFDEDYEEFEEGEDADGNEAASPREVEDDRLYIEMPGYDSSLSRAESTIGVNENSNVPDPFQNWDQGMAVSPEMLNWMLPADKRRPFTKSKEKPWKYFVKANHPDIVELALDVELLRLFISPTGRIRPRRFTGLTAKQQRKLAQAVKISRQMALLPYLSRYPDPTPEQWKAMEEEDIAKTMAEMADDDDNDDDDDDDVDFDEDFEYE